METAVAFRGSWVGGLFIAGTEIPIKLMKANEEKSIQFKMTCPHDGQLIEQVYNCSTDPKHVNLGRGELGRAAPVGDLLYPVSKEEIDSLKETERQWIEITQTRSAYGFDPAYINTTYRVKVEEAFEVTAASLCRALDRTQTIGVGRMIMQRRVHMVALRTDGRRNLSILRLNWPDEIRPSLPVTVDYRADSVQTRDFIAALDGIKVPANQPIDMESDPYNVKAISMIRRKAREATTAELEAAIVQLQVKQDYSS